MYGHKIKSTNLTVDHTTFEKIYKQAGESTLVDLTVDDFPEFLFLFRMDGLPIHAVKTLYDQIDLGETYLKCYNAEKDSWTELSLESKARLMADFDRFTSHGFLWNDCSDYDDLLDCLNIPGSPTSFIIEDDFEGF